MGLFNRTKTNGIINEIRCDETDYLIWKWHPQGTVPGNNQRENAIRWGSSLRVKDGEVAVFVYKQSNSVFQDFIIGPYDEIIKTENLPIISNIIGLAYAGGTPFPAEVYFINLANIIQVRYAVPYFTIYDTINPEFGAPVAVRGAINFKIDDYKNFIKLHRLTTFTIDDFKKQIQDTIVRISKEVVSNIPSELNIPLLHIENKISIIAERIESIATQKISALYGVIVTSVDISAVEIDKTSDDYRDLIEITKKIRSARIQAQNEADIQNIKEKQKIESENYQETLRIQREEAQYAQHKQTQTDNFSAYQTEVQNNIGTAGAEALGNMNSSINGNGFSPSNIISGMVIGQALSQNIAATLNNTISGTNITNNDVPPPISETKYRISKNGRSYGPFTISELKKQVQSGEINSDTLVWKKGLNNWIQASEIDELKSIF